MRILGPAVASVAFAFFSSASASEIDKCDRNIGPGESGYSTDLFYGMTLVSGASLCGGELPGDTEAMVFAKKVVDAAGCNPGTYVYDRLDNLDVSFTNEDSKLFWAMDKSETEQTALLKRIADSVPDFCSVVLGNLARVNNCVQHDRDCDIGAWPMPKFSTQ